MFKWPDGTLNVLGTRSPSPWLGPWEHETGPPPWAFPRASPRANQKGYRADFGGKLCVSCTSCPHHATLRGTAPPTQTLLHSRCPVSLPRFSIFICSISLQLLAEAFLWWLLKSSSENPNMCVIPALPLLTVFSHSSWGFLGSWCDKWLSNHMLDIWGICYRRWFLLKLSILAALLWHSAKWILWPRKGISSNLQQMPGHSRP